MTLRAVPRPPVHPADLPTPRLPMVVGGTPVIRIDHPFVPAGRGFWAKLEGFNPGGIKDRPALHMVSRARERGELLAPLPRNLRKHGERVSDQNAKHQGVQQPCKSSHVHWSKSSKHTGAVSPVITSRSSEALKRRQSSR